MTQYPKVTKGGLVPALITNLKTDKAVAFMFNPKEFTLSKTIEYQEKEAAGKNLGKQEFKRGKAVKLSGLVLHFDTNHMSGSAEDKDVRMYTNPLWEMSMIDPATIDSETKKGTPPVVAFEWHKLYFKAVISRISQKFTMFSPNGVPLRCEVTIDLDQYIDTEKEEAQIPGMSKSAKIPSKTVSAAGVRLDHIAAASRDKTSYREIAAQNKIDNPLRIPNGRSLTT